MANYCINNFTYYGDDQGKILNLYLKIKDAMERIGDSEKDARDLLIFAYHILLSFSFYSHHVRFCGI